MGDNSPTSTVAQFCKRNGYKKYKKKNKNGEYLDVDDPVSLAEFMAFCSGERRRIFLRGCSEDFPYSYPSLYRRDGQDDGNAFCGDNKEAKKHLDAYTYLLEKLRQNDYPKGTRWKRPNVGAILQHYGVRTPWLDVVRNLHAAVWFAMHKIAPSEDDPSRRVVQPSGNEDGWIFLYATSRPGQRQLTVVDLTETHSSKHVRPHAQQGLSLAMQNDPAIGMDYCLPTAHTSDFNTHRIARVRFPANDKRWKLCGHMFSHRFLFPALEHDNSLKQLMDSAVQNTLDEVCAEHCLERGTLGAVYTVTEDHTETTKDSC